MGKYKRKQDKINTKYLQFYKLELLNPWTDEFSKTNRYNVKF